MSLLVVLKLLCDVLFYLTLASSFADKFGARPFLILPVLVLAACWWLSFRLREKGWLRFVPLLGMGLLVPLLSGRTELILFAPAALYCVVLAARDFYGVAQDGYAPLFSIMSRILLGYLFFAVFFVGLDGLERAVLPYTVAFLVCSVLLLRLSRLDEVTLSQPAFQWMNLAYVAGAVVLALLCASPQGRTLALSAGGFVGYYVLRPVVGAVLFVVSGGLNLVARWLRATLLSGLELESEASQELIDFVNQPRPFDQFGEDVVIATPLWAKAVLAAMGLALAGLCLYRLYLRLTAGGSVSRGAQAARRASSPRAARREEARTPNGRVRQEYRRFLRLCRRSRLPLNGCQNSAQVEQAASACFDPQALDELRQVYIRARYGGPPADGEDVKTARRALRRLRQSREEAPEEDD